MLTQDLIKKALKKKGFKKEDIERLKRELSFHNKKTASNIEILADYRHCSRKNKLSATNILRIY